MSSFFIIIPDSDAYDTFYELHDGLSSRNMGSICNSIPLWISNNTILDNPNLWMLPARQPISQQLQNHRGWSVRSQQPGCGWWRFLAQILAPGCHPPGPGLYPSKLQLTTVHVFVHSWYLFQLLSWGRQLQHFCSTWVRGTRSTSPLVMQL